MSGSQKGGAYARALARELPLEHGDLGQSLRDSDSKFARWTLMGLTAP